MLRPIALAVVAGSALSACASMTGSDALPVATGQIARANGTVLGAASVTQGETGLSLMVNVAGMAPGTYGIHVHSVGRCDGPGFTTAGPHWNPSMRQHGRLNPQGSHHGDLPNLVVGADGTGRLNAALAGALAGEGGLLDADGASLIIHARPDDELTDPTGNSGDRQACAVLTPR
jgi:superoxide dismutase, Cu-Zn family